MGLCEVDAGDALDADGRFLRLHCSDAELERLRSEPCFSTGSGKTAGSRFKVDATLCGRPSLGWNRKSHFASPERADGGADAISSIFIRSLSVRRSIPRTRQRLIGRRSCRWLGFSRRAGRPSKSLTVWHEPSSVRVPTVVNGLVLEAGPCDNPATGPRKSSCGGGPKVAIPRGARPPRRLARGPRPIYFGVFAAVYDETAGLLGPPLSAMISSWSASCLAFHPTSRAVQATVPQS